ncbi:MAG: DNA repair protein RadA [Deltaproteobacteria bacterium]|nr:DNA repair protein RadA [Deltaproteobacteria bacterium]
MAKARRVYICQSCGHGEPKWLGRCPTCGEWSTLVEEVIDSNLSAPTSKGAFSNKAVLLNDVADAGTTRLSTGLIEFDRVLGGGLVKGALILVGGDPGIGKSTLLIQAAGCITAKGERALYVSAEESPQQVKMRAARLGITASELYLLAETNLESVEASVRELNPRVLIVDSVQTVGIGEVSSPIGSVTQIRAVSQRLLNLAKSTDLCVFVVGHVTKEGAIAGPKVMEHMVDTVLYFEGERSGPYRILRAHKNRFGSAQEIGIFEMLAEGLTPVANPSELFLSQRAQGSGAAVVTSLEGSRPILLEVQALTSPTLYGNPRRTTIGIDAQRVAMLCAVLERHSGFATSALDVYVNLAGGLRINEPALDLGVMLALASTTSKKVIPFDLVAIGEVGLSGEVRAVGQLAARTAEAAALGFRRVLVPDVDLKRWRGKAADIELVGVATIGAALDAAGLF